MAKVVLVMDMSESCSKCKFMYEFQGIKKCQLMSQFMNVLNGGTSRLSQNSFTEERHEKCPLQELPEKKVADKRLAISPLTEGYLKDFEKDWNVCLDAVKKSVKPH